MKKLAANRLCEYNYVREIVGIIKTVTGMRFDYDALGRIVIEDLG